MSFITATSNLGGINPPTTPSMSFPPQTTPFTPPSSADCKQSVYCPFLTYWIYTSSSDLSGMPCTIVNKLGEGTIGHKTDCFPKGYYAIFNDEYLNTILAGTTEPPESETLAYPGMACMSGWTTACTSVISNIGETYSQAWCCPSSSWGCVTNGGRYCTSVMTESTNIWMTWDPAFTDAHKNEYYTWTADVEAVPTESAATVYRRVFPLQLTVNDGGATNPDNTSRCDGPDSPENCSGDAGSDDGSKPVLSTGVKAGIGAAAGAVSLLVLITCIFLHRRRKSKKSSGEVATLEGNSAPAPTGPALNDKPELEGTTVTQARGVIPKVELDAKDAEHRIPEQKGSEVGSGSQHGTVSPLGTLSPNPTGSDGVFPSPDSRHKSVFEMPG